MQALVFTRPGVVELLDVDEPVPGEGDVVVDVAAVGICGSELHGVTRPGFRSPPLVMGHEFAGSTADGRRVTVNPIVHCGSCDRCRAGRNHLCPERELLGVHRPGAYAERVAVPESRLYDLPAGMTWEQAAMVEPFANGLHAWRLAGAPTGARVGVIGAGTIGLVGSLVARRGGAAEVVVVDVAEDRLGVAGDLGFATATALEGEFDVVIDAVGLAATRRASVTRLARGGTAVWVGLLDPKAGFDALDLIREEKTVVGSFSYTNEEFGAAVDVAAGTELGWVASFPFGDAERLFTELMKGRTDIVKAVLRPSWT